MLFILTNADIDNIINLVFNYMQNYISNIIHLIE